MVAPKKQLTMPQAIVVMVVGGVMLALAIFIPTEAGSSAPMWKVLLGLLGFCVAGVGSYLRPMKPKTEK
jgi:uncharacterized protein (DUF983 family)